MLLKGLSGEMQSGSKMGSNDAYLQTIYRFAAVFIFKETPSREKHKTSFGVLTTTELNLQVELTKSCKRRAVYIQFNRFFAPIPAQFAPNPAGVRT